MNLKQDFLYVYVDESGDLGKFGSKYFTISAICTSEPNSLRRIIKNVRQRKLKKRIKELPELKANSSDRLIKEFVLDEVSKTDCLIFAIVIKKDKVMNNLFDVKNRLYNYLCGLLIERIMLPSNKLIIVIDKKHTNTLMREDFNSYIKSKINTKDPNLKIDISHRESYTLNELQVIDFVAWSINRKFNVNDDYYFKFIENKIVNRDDLLLWKR